MRGGSYLKFSVKNIFFFLFETFPRSLELAAFIGSFIFVDESVELWYWLEKHSFISLNITEEVMMMSISCW